MVSMSFGRIEIRSLLKGIMIVLAGALMILPAYLNHLIFSGLRFELAVSLSISFMLFAFGILIFILAVGTEAFEKKQSP